MTFFEEFFSNHIFLTAACGWFVAQILKTLIHLIISKKFVAERLVGSGGMPSSHSATVCALVTATCYEYGAGSFEFAISLILAIIVMYDAGTHGCAVRYFLRRDHLYFCDLIRDKV